jgi:hypothetical protein
MEPNIYLHHLSGIAVLREDPADVGLSGGRLAVGEDSLYNVDIPGVRRVSNAVGRIVESRCPVVVGRQSGI